MSKYGRILSSDFLEAARKFSSKFRGLLTKGIAMVSFFFFTLFEVLFILIMKLILIVILLQLYN